MNQDIRRETARHLLAQLDDLVMLPYNLHQLVMQAIVLPRCEALD